MKRTLLPISILVIAIILFSCASNETSESNKVLQSEIFQSYSITYSSSNNDLDVFAGYRFGGENGTTLKLVEKSMVFYNDIELKSHTSGWFGTSYSYKKQTTYSPQHRLKYINNDGEVFENSIELFKAEPILKDNKITKSQGCIIEWDGQATSGKDNLQISIADSNQTLLFKPEMVGANSLTIKPEQIKQLKVGVGNISIERQIFSSLQKPTLKGGKISSTYHSKTIKINIVE